MSKEQITRKEAIKKMGKYAAITALGTYLILNPKKAQAGSPHSGGINTNNWDGEDFDW